MLSLLSLLLLSRVSAKPISTCDVQRPCFRTEFEFFGPGQNDPDHDNTMHVCQVIDRSDGECQKDDAISYVCSSYNAKKRSGFGGNVVSSEECQNDAVDTICHYNAPCFDINGDPIDPEDRYVEFNFKDGQGCDINGQSGPDCTFVDPDDTAALDACCGFLDGNIEDCEASGQTPCCSSYQAGNWCAGDDDPLYQISCEPASEATAVCEGKNYKGCTHKVYYECPDVPCATDPPTTDPTTNPTPPTPQPTGGNGQCTRQNNCLYVDITFPRSGLGNVAQLSFTFDTNKPGCNISPVNDDGTINTLSHVCVPNEYPQTVLDYDCDVEGVPTPQTCYDSEPGDGVYDACDCDNTEFKDGNGDGPVIKIEGLPPNGGFTLTESCENAAEAHFHFSIKDQNECLDTAVFADGNLLCVSGVEANYCDDNENGQQDEFGKDCFYSYWFCRDCPQYQVGNPEYSSDYVAACELAIETEPHPDHPHSNNAAMNGEQNEENVFGLKGATRSETAGLMSVIVIIVSIVSVVGTVMVYKYVTRRNRGAVDKAMLSVPDTPTSPAPTSPVSVESGHSAEVVTNDGVIIQA